MKTAIVIVSAATFCSCVTAFVPSGRKQSSWKLRRLDPLFSSVKTTLPEGITKTVSKPGSGKLLKPGDIATVKYSCYVPNSAPFARSESQKVVVGRAGMIDGWEAAIKTMEIGERAVVRISDPTLGYGTNGVPPVVPPDAVIELDMEILASSPPLKLDFNDIGNQNLAPTKASEIAKVFDEKMRKKAAAGELEKKEGLDFWIDRFQNAYIFGLFDSETGETPPWFLRPSITFPLAFLAVGGAFYFLVASGGITRRGEQVKDELDQVLLASFYLRTINLPNLGL